MNSEKNGAPIGRHFGDMIGNYRVLNLPHPQQRGWLNGRAQAACYL